MPIVVDASVALSWLTASQSTPAADAFASRADDFEAPAIFAAETRNVALKLERRGIVKPPRVDAWLTSLEARVILIPDADDSAARDMLVALSRAEMLGYFDAIYLDLALRRNAGLASRDGALLAAAARRGLSVFDLRGV